MKEKPKLKFKEKKIQYDMNYHKNKFGNWIKDENLYRLRCEYARRNYFWFVEPKHKIFEYGCGVGQNIAWHKNSYGYEINKEMYPLLKSKGITMFDKEEDIPDDKFDVIITCMVLEHIENPIKTINFLKKKLKKDGLLITVLPPVTYKRKTGMNESTDGHLYAWTFYEINYLLNFCGFENIYNNRIYRYGIERFKMLPDSQYFFFLKFFGKLFGYFDIIIISRKMK